MRIKRINDRGYKNMLENVRKAHGKEIQAGIFKGARASRSANGSLADNLAYRYKIHDQGLGNNPKRETLAPAFADSIKSDTLVKNFLALNLDSNRSFRTQARRVSLRLAANIKKAITALRTPAKREETIRAAQRRYGGNRRTNPLIQTEEMRNSVSARYLV